MTEFKVGKSLKGLFALGVVVVLLLVVGTVLSQGGQKSNAEKFAECNTNAGKIYDADRQMIAQNTNGYSPAEQQVYYQRTENAYGQDLANCRQWYGPWQTCADRLYRWRREGLWDRLLTHVHTKSDAVGEVIWEVSIDSSTARAHQHASGARRRRS